MQPTSYTHTFSDKERKVLILILGYSFPKMAEAVTPILSPAAFLAMCERIIDGRPDAQTVRNMSGTAAAHAIAAPAPAAPEPRTLPNTPPAPPALRDIWGMDRKGNRHAPADYETKELTVISVTHQPAKGSTPELWRVQFRGLKANCFDGEVSAFLTAAAKQSTVTTVYVKVSGAYTNVVGVRA